MSNKKIWFITGAGRGMGADFATAALAAGHGVVATGRDTGRVSKALGQSNDLLSVTLDVTRRTDAETAVRAAIDQFGRIAVSARGHHRVAGRHGGLGEIGAHAAAGARDEPDLLSTHDVSLFLAREFRNARCGTRSQVRRPPRTRVAPSRGESFQLSIAVRIAEDDVVPCAREDRSELAAHQS